MRYLRTEKLRSFHLRPFIVLIITKRAHYKAERETTCSVNMLELVSPNQPDLQQLWSRSTSKPNPLSVSVRVRVRSAMTLGTTCIGSASSGH